MMLEVVVKRSEWYRGQGVSDSRLLQAEGEMKCCLGFAELAAGVPKEELRGKCSPANLLGKNKAPGLVEDAYNTGDCLSLMHANDTRFSDDGLPMTEQEREAKIIELGKEAGILFRFED